jgi:tripartite-type tricarboxylate transporter receptor subunit TctC
MGMSMIRGLLAAILVSIATAATAQAPAWPQRPVKFIIPFGPGAGADIGARPSPGP